MKPLEQGWSKKALIVLLVILLVSAVRIVISTPVGPSITFIKNETNTQYATETGTMVNQSPPNATSGGYIWWINLDGSEQNKRWKAFVGNVSGELVLDDANGYSIYTWDLGLTSGEVYATRASGNINWTNINCSWMAARSYCNATLNKENCTGWDRPYAGDGNWTFNASNRTISELENVAMDLLYATDNITTTFWNRSHRYFKVGTVHIWEDSCYAIHPYINNTEQHDYFDEVLLYDGSEPGTGNIIYAGMVENNSMGYSANFNITFDFQILVPERGTTGWSGSTPYYFYVELT